MTRALPRPLAVRVVRSAADDVEQDVVDAAGSAVRQFMNAARASVFGEPGSSTSALVAGGVPSLNGWPDDGSWAAIAWATIRPAVKRAFASAWELVHQSGSTSQASDAADSWIDDNAEWITSTSFPRDAYEQASRALSVAELNAADDVATAEAVRAALANSAFAWRADLIGRTLSQGAFNAGMIDAAADVYGTAAGKRWEAIEDIRTRPDHVDAHGQTVPLHEPFEVGGESLMFPGDPNGTPAQIANCRCVAMFVPDFEGDQMQASSLTAAAPAPAAPVDVQDVPDAPEQDAPDGPDIGKFHGPLAKFDRPNANGDILGKLGASGTDVRARPMPLPLSYQDASTDVPHGSSVVVGRITDAWVAPNPDDPDGDTSAPWLHISGDYDMNDPRAADVARKVADGYLGWASFDMDDVTAEFVPGEDSAEGGCCGDDSGDSGPPLSGNTLLKDWRLMGATLVQHQAEPGARMKAGAPPIPEPEPDADELEGGNGDDEDEFETPTGPGYTQDIEWAAALTAAAQRRDTSLRYAAVSTVRPPRAWFDDPQLSGPTPITVTDDGRVFGHAAQFGVCHTGFRAECILTPRTQMEYGAFHLESVTCDDGSRISAGFLTDELPEHPSTSMDRLAAAYVYAAAGRPAAVVRAGEDKYGIWVAGVLAPGVTRADLDGKALSGDWREIAGSLELIDVMVLPDDVPAGFPVRAQYSGGQPVALTAAGVIRPSVAALLPVQRAEIVSDLGTEIAAALRRFEKADQVRAQVRDVRVQSAREQVRKIREGR